MISGHLRGHLVIFIGDEWLYEDTNEPTTGNERVCNHCGKENTPEGHDGCLGTLPGLINACCGHGNPKNAYAQLLDGTVISHEDALSMFTILKQGESL